jgi:hypothetical protein
MLIPGHTWDGGHFLLDALHLVARQMAMLGLYMVIYLTYNKSYFAISAKHKWKWG